MRILFVPTYTNGIVRGEVDAASDAVGYGITAAAVLVEQLGVLGHAVDTINIVSRRSAAVVRRVPGDDREPPPLGALRRHLLLSLVLAFRVRGSKDR